MSGELLGENMKKHGKIWLCTILLVIMMAPRILAVAFEERKPRDEKSVLVPRGARPMLKEEYPRRQLVVERIKARHQHAVNISFVRSWNTAAVTAVAATQGSQDLAPNDYEFGIALHSQRLRVGSLRNREYFKKETEGFPEGWYRPFRTVDEFNRPTGYMSTNFVHIAAKKTGRIYDAYRDFSYRVNGILNAVGAEKKQFTAMARRDMNQLRVVDGATQSRIRNTASMDYKIPGRKPDSVAFHGESVWSTLVDATGRDLRYISGIGIFNSGRELRPDFNVDLEAKLKISTLREHTQSPEPKVLELRKSGSLQVANTVALTRFLRLRLDVAGLYDSRYKGYFMPKVELALMPKVFHASLGVRRHVAVPDRDRLYWSSKLVKVNDELEPEAFWEAYASLGADIIARLKFVAEASYSRPESRVSWRQLPGYVWEPVNIKTSEALKAQASLLIELLGSLGTFGSVRYDYFDTQSFDPRIGADVGLFYGDLFRGAMVLGASYWDFKPLESAESPENPILVYVRISKSIRRVVNIFIDGRYTINREDLEYYCGMPQAGRIVSFGMNIVFGGLN